MSAVVLLGWCAGWLLFVGTRRCAAASSSDEIEQNVSVIIPARDEEENLPRLLRSIAPHNAIVVDDCSRDRTYEIAQEHGARVIRGTPPPKGWRGKTWACQQGADAADGDLLLFLDADTWFERGGLAAMAHAFAGGGALSIAPYHSVPTLREQFSAFFNLVMIGGAGPNDLLGQCLLIERTSYVKSGGHRAVRDQVIENFRLGRKLRGARSRLGRGVLNVRMYPHGWRDMINGWSKSFASGAAQTSPLRFALVTVWVTGAVFALGHGATYAAFALQLAILLRRVGAYWIVTALLYPLPLAFFFAVFARSIFRTGTRGSISWKGRPVRAV